MLSKAALPRDKIKTPTRADLAASQKKVSLQCQSVYAAQDWCHCSNKQHHSAWHGFSAGQSSRPGRCLLRGLLLRTPCSKLLCALMKYAVKCYAVAARARATPHVPGSLALAAEDCHVPSGQWRRCDRLLSLHEQGQSRISPAPLDRGISGTRPGLICNSGSDMHSQLTSALHSSVTPMLWLC